MSDLLNGEFGGDWAEHPEHTGYFFSRCGRAASIKNGKPKMLIGCSSGQRGYRAISVPLGGGKYGRVYLHRAVCQIFNGGDGDGLHCRHLDCDQTNNAASNLAWGTPKENAADGIRNGRIRLGESNPGSKLNRKQVEEMRRIRQETGEFYHHIAARFGVSRMTAHRAITGALWK